MMQTKQTWGMFVVVCSGFSTPYTHLAPARTNGIRVAEFGVRTGKITEIGCLFIKIHSSTCSIVLNDVVLVCAAASVNPSVVHSMTSIS